MPNLTTIIFFVGWIVISLIVALGIGRWFKIQRELDNSQENKS